LTQLRGDADVLYAQPDYLRHTFAQPVVPDDPLYGQQWALPMIRAPQGWEHTSGSERVTVAILDTGIVLHPELATRVVPGYDFITSVANSGDGDGRDADPTDYSDDSPGADGLHGTHVSGIVAASSNNNIGVAGLDWGCRLLPVRVLGISGNGADSDIADAIRWAAGIHVDGVPDNANPAAVINMSFGGVGASPSMQDAINDALAMGVTVIAAAGNDGVDAKTYAPAGLSGVITVGAVDINGLPTRYTNYGLSLALMAPGGDTSPGTGVLSTIRYKDVGFTYGVLAGTSQAAPFVSGTVSLMKAVFPAMTPADARAYLTASANPAGKCQNPTDMTQSACGAGLLDVEAALATTAAQAQILNRPTTIIGGSCAVAGRASAPPWLPALLLGLLLIRRAWRA
jgi:serine protease